MRASLIALATAAALSAGAAHAQSANYAIDPTHTFATFEIDHYGATTNRGRLNKKTGSITLDKTAKKGKVDISLQTASVSTGTAAFDMHLKSAELFNSAKFPTMRFVGEQFTFDGDKVAQVAGNLTLLGKTAPLTLKATKFACYENPMLKREVCGGDFEGTVDRSAFGMNYGIDWGFPKDVRIVVQVEAIKQ